MFGVDHLIELWLTLLTSKIVALFITPLPVIIYTLNKCVELKYAGALLAVTIKKGFKQNSSFKFSDDLARTNA